LGTLTNVNVALSLDVTAELLVYNENNYVVNFTNATATVPVTVTGPTDSDNLNLSITPTAEVSSGTVAALTQNTYSGLTVSASGSENALPVNFGFWETAPVNLSLNFNASDSSTFSGQSGLRILFGGTALGDATTTVTYTYTPSVAPEPAVTGLVAAALAALLLFGLFRNRDRVMSR
jgi:hypothetical protein